ncbi:uncharacterized protein LOC129910995 isoform X2 [Episyrphus balteatus]|uniref:uncharacterized protein LOC129910995 isoform X2 n=1 Tax=Episyrphus balteatus TaxID=286459 RepID=UPI002485EF7C|nr:uncharacterized protein LOC129910995 isoform X2 [Episyrphus balteatus]
MPKTRGCVLKCSNFTHTYGFPKDEIGKSVWLKQLGLQAANKSAGVCDRHFSSQMLAPGIGYKLTQWAIPDINLPEPVFDDEEDDYSDEYYLEEGKNEINESILNGYSKIDKLNQEKINNDVSKAPVKENHHLNESGLQNDPLDFEDMIDSQQQNNNNNHKAMSVDYGEYEEVFEDEEVETLDDENLSNRDVVSDEDTISAPQEPVEINSKFKRKLIACVRRRRILYDPAHPCFGNVDKKSRAWDRIGNIVKMDGAACRELWLNLRYNYQNHARSLRRWLAGESNQRERPRLQFENDLIFLWRFIDDDTCDDNDETLFESPKLICHKIENVIKIDKPLDDEEEKSKNFVGNLIDAVQCYSEIYDTNHANYGDAKRRSVIWEGIANELKEKATKCLFSWIQIVMRYEFELTKNKHSYLVVKMKFMEKHIIVNEKSPFKRSTTLTDEWMDPLYSCEEQHLLIAAMISNKKTRPYFANIDCPFATLDLLKITQWNAIAKARSIKATQCEVTWIIVQIMYCELADYRRKDCCLREEWELESIITNLRDTIVKNSKPKITEESILKPQLPDTNKSNDFTSTCDESNDIEMLPDNDDIQLSFPPPSSMPPPPPPPLPQPAPIKLKNEITFKIPGINPGDEEILVRYELDIPLSELPETSVVDVGSVLENAHIVILSHFKSEPKAHLFTLEKRRELIGEVMARPIIFNEPCKTSRITRLFMGEIASDIGVPAGQNRPKVWQEKLKVLKKQDHLESMWTDVAVKRNFPVEACLAFWEYIVEKSYFVDYDPSWKKSEESKWIPAPYPIFEKFQKYAESKNWNEYIPVLSDFMQEIGNFPLIYSDLKINSTWNRRQCYVRDISEVWAILARKFVVLENHKLIWDKFRQIYLLYMSEIELSMYNPWPPFWAPVFEKMKYLFEYKYNPKDPIYYVLRVKIDEEMRLCNQNAKPTMRKLDAVNNAKVIFQLLKENEYLEDFTWVNRARFISKLKSFPMLYDINHAQFGNKEAKMDAWQEMALLFHCTVGECHLIFQHLMKSFLIFRARDPNQMCRVNAKYWENMTYIYSCALPNAIDPKSIRGRSFRSSSNGSTIKLAEEYQAEISLVDAKPRLILKNFASAINSLPTQLQTSVTQHLRYVFSEYTRIQNEEIVVDV